MVKMNKKGALELSVGAIVILILAIVMLGLGLGFIRGMFGKVSTQFEEQIAAEPEPPAPSSSDPITLSRENLIVHAGDPIALKVGIQNPSNLDWANTTVTIGCSGTAVPIVSNPKFNAKALTSGDSFTATYLFVIGKVGKGTYLCQAKSQYLSGTALTDTGYTKDMTIKVI